MIRTNMTTTYEEEKKAYEAIEEAMKQRWNDPIESMETLMDDEEPREVEWGTSERDGFEAFSNY